MSKAVKKYLSNLRLSYALRGKDIILLFHYVGENTSFDAKFHAVTSGCFQQIIKSFRKKWDFVDEEEFMERHKHPAQRPAALLTFDDGYKDTLKACEWLIQQQIPFIYFVNPALIEGDVLWRDLVRVVMDSGKISEFVSFAGLTGLSERNFYAATKRSDGIKSNELARKLKAFCLDNNIQVNGGRSLHASANDIKEQLDNRYMKLGNHTTDHYLLSTLSKSEQEHQLAESHQYLEQTFGKGHLSRIFSVPFGDADSFNDITVSLLDELGYKAFLLTGSGQFRKRSHTLAVEGYKLPAYSRLLPKAHFRLYHF